MFGRFLRPGGASAPSWLLDLPAALADGMYALDHRFRFTFVNPAAELHWERQAGSLMHQTIWDVFPGLVGGLMHTAHLGALRQRKAEPFTGPSGVDHKWVEGKAHPHKGGLMVVFHDITERRRRAASLRECHARLGLLFDHSGVGLGEADSGGRLLRVNPRMTQCFGQALVGSTLDEILPGGAERLRQVLDTGLPDEVELQVERPDGSSPWLFTALSAALGSDGSPDSLLLVVHDLSHRRAAEQALKSLNASLEARVAHALAERASVEESLRQSQKMEALGQLAGGVAHDFNNVLQAINGGARLILRKPADPDTVKRLAGLIVEAADRGANVTRRLLSFARRDALQAERVEAGPLLSDLADVLAHTLGRRVAVSATCDGAPVTLADRGQLETVLVNLSTNARDAMPDGGSLVLGAAGETVPPVVAHPAGLQPGEYVRFSVTDTGTGMDSGTLVRATEPFFTTKPRGKGTGLGLSMARGFAEQSGGGLRITSLLGKGTSVELWLPVAGHPAPEPASQAPRARVRVLLVDDDSHVREVLTGELEALGCDVVPRDSAAAALAWIDAGHELDLLVSDLSMPGTDGLTTIREAQLRRPRLPAVLLTGYAGDGLEVAIGSTFGAPTALLRKPVRGADLAAALSGLVHTTPDKDSDA